GEEDRDDDSERKRDGHDPARSACRPSKDEKQIGRNQKKAREVPRDRESKREGDRENRDSIAEIAECERQIEEHSKGRERIGLDEREKGRHQAAEKHARGSPGGRDIAIRQRTAKIEDEKPPHPPEKTRQERERGGHHRCRKGEQQAPIPPPQKCGEWLAVD